jgi:CRISPR-associated protein Cmr3
MSSTGTQTWSFRALDTLFFRESRPMESIGNAELSSLFPPSARTMTGAIRSVLGELHDVDWREYHKQKHDHPLAQLIGYGDDDLGPLHFSGVWIHKNGERLYPAPLNIMRRKGDDGKDQLFFITIGEEPVQTDLGNVRLPLLQKERIGSKPLENFWLPGSEFSKILRGEVPDLEQCVSLLPQSPDVVGGHLLVEEARIGIARDNSRRVVEKGLLYQTRHVRLADDVSLCMDVSGLSAADSPAENHLTRLGGEGRMASISVESPPPFLPQPDWNADAKGVVLYLLTPLLIGRSGGDWQPLPGFKRCEKNGQTLWEGELNGISLTLHTAITGKAQREGGWDLQKHAPRAVKSYIPAGSVFYCIGSDEPLKLIRALHGSQIGEEQELGRGKIAVGLWRE